MEIVVLLPSNFVGNWQHYRILKLSIPNFPTFYRFLWGPGQIFGLPGSNMVEKYSMLLKSYCVRCEYMQLTYLHSF